MGSDLCGRPGLNGHTTRIASGPQSPAPYEWRKRDRFDFVPGRPADDTPPSITSISDEAVDKTRAWTGLYVVIGGDVAIAVAVAIALIKFAGTAGNASTAVLASVLSSAFAAIATMTTAYFGIRASSNTAQRSIKHHADAPGSRPAGGG